MDDMNAVFSFLGLMKKAGALAVGAENAVESCLGGRGKLIVTAKGVSRNTLSWLKETAERKEIPIAAMECDMAGLGGALGVGECACAAVCDTGFAISLCGKLGLGEQEEALRLRQEREKRRKAKKLAGKAADTPKRGK